MNSFFNKTVNFKKIIDEIKIIQNISTDCFLHNKYRIKYINKSSNTFVGKYNCGVTCFVLFKFLKNKNIDTKVIKNSIYIKTKLYDHVVLKYNNNIIDPTYRQFLIPDYNNLDTSNNIGIDKYHEYLFSKPFIFIQNYCYLKKILNECNDIHKETYNMSLNLTLAETLINIDGTDITEKYENLLK